MKMIRDINVPYWIASRIETSCINQFIIQPPRKTAKLHDAIQRIRLVSRQEEKFIVITVLTICVSYTYTIRNILLSSPGFQAKHYIGSLYLAEKYNQTNSSGEYNKMKL